MSDSPTVDDVRTFWENAPLFVGESRYPAGSAEFFQEHARVIIDDCFAGQMDERIFPVNRDGRVLDLGCGPGFWLTQFASRGFNNLHGADLTERALEIAASRCRLLGISCSFQRENAESLSFPDNSFDHVNCQGVIHHTPDTAGCVREIARVLKPGGTASLSVYFKNAFLRQWWWMRHPARLASFCGAKLKGRGREGIFATPDVDSLVRLYDGQQNPIGKAFSQAEFRSILAPFFRVDEIFVHFFPRRSLPIPIAPALHRWLDRNLGFMICARVHKDGLPVQARLAA